MSPHSKFQMFTIKTASIRLSLQVKTGHKSTKSCFSFCCCDVLCILHAFEHHKVNLIKHDLSRLERLISRQFEDLKYRDV